MSSCLMFGGWETLEAQPMLGRVFEHQTKGFKVVRHEVAYVIVLIDDLVKTKPAVPSAVA